MLEKLAFFGGLIPQFDGQTIFSLIVGLIVSAVTFYWGYKNTIGVKEERVRIANAELSAAALRRLAIEREQITAVQFQSLRKTKSYRAAVPIRRLWQFGDVLDAVVTDIFDNSFVDPTSKAHILQLIDESRLSHDLTQPGEPSSQSRESAPFALLAAFSAIAGGAVSVLSAAVPAAELEKIFETADLSKVALVASAIILWASLGSAILFKLMERKRRKPKLDDEGIRL